MPKSDNQKLKIFYILDYLKENSHEDHPVRAAELISMLDKKGIRCDRKTVYSDVAALMDFGVLMFTFPLRTLRCAAAELLYHKNPFMTFLITMLGCVRVEREQCDFSFMDRLKAVLDKGGVVEIFPESRLPDKAGDTRPMPFKPSYVYLALETGAPIIPVYHNGCAFRSERLQVVVGKPRTGFKKALTNFQSLKSAYVQSSFNIVTKG